MSSSAIPESDAANRASSDRRTRSPSLDAVRRGCKGGAIATVLLTVYRLPIFRGLPPTAEFWARYVGGGEPEEYPIPGLVLHLCYGTVAGGVFGAIFQVLGRRFPTHRELLGVVAGAVYGLVLSLVGTRVVFRRLLGRGLEPDHDLVFHVGHLVYGLTLGTWLASREPLGDVYETPPKR